MFRRERNTCEICWTALNTGTDFQLSGSGNMAITDSKYACFICLFLVIKFPSNFKAFHLKQRFYEKFGISFDISESSVESDWKKYTHIIEHDLTYYINTYISNQKYKKFFHCDEFIAC